jgi:hypothetical protein
MVHHSREACRGENEWQCGRLAQDLRAEVDYRHVVQDVWMELDFAKSAAGTRNADLAFSGTVRVVEHSSWDSPMGELAKVADSTGPSEAPVQGWNPSGFELE